MRFQLLCTLIKPRTATVFNNWIYLCRGAVRFYLFYFLFRTNAYYLNYTVSYPTLFKASLQAKLLHGFEGIDLFILNDLVYSFLQHNFTIRIYDTSNFLPLYHFVWSVFKSRKILFLKYNKSSQTDILCSLKLMLYHKRKRHEK